MVHPQICYLNVEVVFGASKDNVLKCGPKETDVGKVGVLFLKGIGLGFGLGMCLAGMVGLIYRAFHNGPVGHGMVYFFIVGGLMGTLGGWGLALQLIIGNQLAALFLKVAELVPLPAQVVGEDWAKKMETFFREVIQPFPKLFRKFIEFFLIVRFEDYGRMNRALDKARKKEPSGNFTAQWMLMVILHYLLEPLWLFFYAGYGILLILSCILWSFAFFR